MPLKYNVLEGEAIDSDYRENVKVILPNFSNKRVEFNNGDCIAQILFQKKELPKFIQVSNLTILLKEGKIKDLDQLEFKWLLTTKYLNMYPVTKSGTKEMV